MPHLLNIPIQSYYLGTRYFNIQVYPSQSTQCSEPLQDQATQNPYMEECQRKENPTSA